MDTSFYYVTSGTVGASEAALDLEYAEAAIVNRLDTSFSARSRKKDLMDELDALCDESIECADSEAQPMSKEAFYWAYRFVENLPEYLPLPEVTFDDYGHCCFEWYTNPEMLLNLSVTDEGQIIYVAFLGKTRSYRGTQEVAGGLTRDLISLIQRVVHAR